MNMLAARSNFFLHPGYIASYGNSFIPEERVGNSASVGIVRMQRLLLTLPYFPGGYFEPCEKINRMLFFHRIIAAAVLIRFTFLPGVSGYRWLLFIRGVPASTWDR